MNNYITGNDDFNPGRHSHPPGLKGGGIYDESSSAAYAVAAQAIVFDQDQLRPSSGSIVRQITDPHAKETGKFRQQFFFRLPVSVFPVRHGTGHQLEQLINPGPGHPLAFPQKLELRSE
jgi:hypothetical protein